MYIPSTKVMEILEKLEGVKVYKNRPEKIAELPSVTYYIANNRVEADLGKEIGYQEIEVVVDIWTRTAKEGAGILSDLEESMREEGFMLSFSSDVNDPDGVNHITNRFNFII